MGKFLIRRPIKEMFSVMFTAEDRKNFYRVSFIILLSGAFELISIASIVPFLTVASDQKHIHTNKYLSWFYSNLNFQSERNFLVATGVALTILMLLVNMLRVFTLWSEIKFTWSMYHRLSVRLLRKYMGQSFLKMKGQNSAVLLKNMQHEINEVATQVIAPILRTINSGGALILTVGLLIIVDPLLTLGVGCLVTLGYLGLYLYSQRSLKEIGDQSLSDNNLRFKTLSEAFNAFKVAKLANVEDIFISRFSKASNRYCTNQARRYSTSSLPRYGMEVVAFGIMIGITIYSIVTMEDFSKAIPAIGLFAFAAFKIMPGAQQLYVNFTVLRSTSASLLHMIEEFRNDDYEEKDEVLPKGIEKNGDYPVLEFQNVYFSYPNSEKPTLKGMSFSLYSNMSMGIVGETGGGKSTTLDLILGLLNPSEGKIKIYGETLSSENLRSWQHLIGYVPQEIYLIDDTIRNNVAFGVQESEIDMDKVKKACSMANISEFIENNLPEQYETIAGERGARLSGGQKQRIGIARALYHDPELLVFDEATSSLDNETERQVMEAIEKLSGKKTLIMVAHRISTLKNCHQILELKEGRGTPKEMTIGFSK